MLRKEKEELLRKIFEDSALFEQEVLGIFYESDRKEVLLTLAKRIVRQKYKERFNFLYLREFSDFTPLSLPSVLLQELIQEFSAFCLEYLYLTKEDLLVYVGEKKKRDFMSVLAQRYVRDFGFIFFQEMAESFFELILTLPHPDTPNSVVEEVLKSPLVKNQNILVIRSFEQLYRRIRAAQNYKNTELSKLQIKIAEISDRLQEAPADTNLLKSFENLQKKLKDTVSISLDHYDAALKRVKDTMIKTLSGQIL